MRGRMPVNLPFSEFIYVQESIAVFPRQLKTRWSGKDGLIEIL